MELKINRENNKIFFLENKIKEERKFKSKTDKIFNYYLPLGIAGTGCLPVALIVIPVFAALSCTALSTRYISSKFSEYKFKHSLNEFDNKEKNAIILINQIYQQLYWYQIKKMAPAIIPIIGIGFIIHMIFFSTFNKKELVGDLADQYNKILTENPNLGSNLKKYWDKEHFEYP